MNVEPYAWVRTVTLGMGSLWTLLGLLRLRRFARHWESRLIELGASRAWLRRQIWRGVLRVTVYDPINLALLLVLVGIWSAKRWV